MTSLILRLGALWLAGAALGCSATGLSTSPSPVPTQAMCPAGTTLVYSGTPGIYHCR